MSWLALSAGLVLTAVGCSEDVNVGDGDCPAGQTVNPISGECQAQCPAGQRFDPIGGLCVRAPGNGTNNDDANNGLDVGGLDDASGPGDNNGPGTNNGPGPGDTGGNPTCTPGVNCPGDGDTGGLEDVEPYQPQDPGTAVYHGCTSADTRNLTPPQFIMHDYGNYLLAAHPAATASEIRPTAGRLDAHVFEDVEGRYTGFVVSLSPRSNQTTSAQISDEFVATVKSIAGLEATTVREAGRSLRTHDGYTAHVRAALELPGGTALQSLRDTIMGRMIGLAPQTLQHDLSHDFSTSAGEPLVLVYKVVRRSSQQYLLVATLARRADYQNATLPTATRVDDLAGGTALAYARESMVDDCIAYTIRDTNEVDIVISLDASGSMSGVQAQLANFARDFTQYLDSLNLDWRIAVTGVDCNNIKNDTALSQEFRDLWPESSGGGIFGGLDDSCNLPFGGGGSGGNGRLQGGNFTTDFNEISDRMLRVSTTGSEFTLTMGAAAIDRSLPRADDRPDKIRTNAASVLVVVTDEAEQLFKDKFSFVGGSRTLSQSQHDELNAYAQPWIDYLQRPDIATTVFGLYWLPGQGCEGASDIAYGIDRVVSETGGEGGSVCQPDVTTTFRDIANAARDLSSGIRLIGSPVASTIRVHREGLNDGSTTDLVRSRVDGYDFDAHINSVTFQGPSAPQLDERVVIPYLRWNRTVTPCETTDQCPANVKLQCINGACR